MSELRAPVRDGGRRRQAAQPRSQARCPARRNPAAESRAAQVERIAAGRADEFRARRVTAGCVAQTRGNAALQPGPAPLPAPGGERHREQVPSAPRQSVLEPRRSRAVADPIENLLVDQCPQPVRQRRAGRPGALDEFLESARALEGVPQDQQRPAVADHVDGARDRTRGDVEGDVRHERHCSGRRRPREPTPSLIAAKPRLLV